MKTSSRLSSMVITHLDPGAAASEAFRVLRTNLQFMGLDKPLKSILVTSATPGEGKTTTAVNLAVAFAQTGARVCLVDADLRRPMVAKSLGLSNWSGLTTALVNQKGLSAYVQETEVPGMSVMTSGPVPPNPSELLGTHRMTLLLRELEAEYDIVILDTPPVLVVTDAAVLGPQTGGVILVTRAGMVARQQAQRAKDALLAVKAPVLGVVLGAVPVEGGSSRFYDYYGVRRSKGAR